MYHEGRCHLKRKISCLRKLLYDMEADIVPEVDMNDKQANLRRASRVGTIRHGPFT